MREEILSDEELAQAISEAEEIESRPKPKYNYNDEGYKGGPRHCSREELESAAIELSVARHIYDEQEEVFEAARTQLYEAVKRSRDDGIPVDFIARFSGLKYRSRVYQVIGYLKNKESKTQ